MPRPGANLGSFFISFIFSLSLSLSLSLLDHSATAPPKGLFSLIDIIGLNRVEIGLHRLKYFVIVGRGGGIVVSGFALYPDNTSSDLAGYLIFCIAL